MLGYLILARRRIGLTLYPAVAVRTESARLVRGHRTLQRRFRGRCLTAVNRLRASRTAGREAVGQQLGQATAHLLEKNLSIAPTLKIRPGYRFAILAVKDLTFDRPYVVGDY